MNAVNRKKPRSKPTPKSNRRVVGIGALVVSNCRNDTLVTFGLGSCLGITAYDPEAGVGALLHIMLPLSKLQKQDSEKNPLRYVETGVPMLFKACYALGAEKRRMIVRVAGGASVQMLQGAETLQIGKRNIIALKRLMLKNHVLIAASDVGGTKSRTLSMFMDSGRVEVSSQGKQYDLERAKREEKQL